MLNTPNKLSFIVADDDTEDQALIHEALRSIDICTEHTSVFNGRQLLDFLRKTGIYKDNKQSHPDAIILDLNMPVMSGLEALKEIKNDPNLREIPVFILYTLTRNDYSIQCRSLGIAGLYLKPSTSQELKNILKEVYLICGGKIFIPNLTLNDPLLQRKGFKNN